MIELTINLIHKFELLPTCGNLKRNKLLPR